MSGKYIVAALLAVSTTSAATVGVVYTGVVPPRHGEAPAASAEAASPIGAVKSAVVLNAQTGSFDRFADSAEGPVCPGQAAATSCVMVSGASSIRLNILGYTVTFPPVWLGGDSEDQYFAEGFPWLEDPSFFGPWTAVGRRRPSIGSVAAGTDDGDPTAGSQSQDQSGSQSFSTRLDVVFGPASPNLPFLSEAVGPGATLFLGAATGDSPGRSDWRFSPGALFPTPVSVDAPGSSQPDAPELVAAQSRPAVPFFSGETTFGGDAPEPSTWLMTIAGFATLGLFKRRRIASALRSSAR